QHCQIAGEADGEGRKEKMEADSKGELQPGKEDRVEGFKHGLPLIEWAHLPSCRKTGIYFPRMYYKRRKTRCRRVPGPAQIDGFRRLFAVNIQSKRIRI